MLRTNKNKAFSAVGRKNEHVTRPPVRPKLGGYGSRKSAVAQRESFVQQ